METKHQIVVEAKATTTTDLGEFVALAAAYTVDRVGDRIVPGAFAKTIDRWQASGKQVPLHWNHEGDPEYIIGSIDPKSLEETDEGLRVSGRLDLENSDKAREAWRAIKSDSMSLSFGYMVVEQKQAKDGVNDLLELDLFEVSIVPGPANADTRFLALKSVPEMDAGELLAELNQLRKRIDEIAEALEDKPPADDDDDREQAPPEDPPQASDPAAVRTELERIDALV